MSKSSGSFDPTLKKAITIALVIILAFSFGYVFGAANNIKVNHNNAPAAAPTANTTPTETPAPAPTEAPTEAPVIENPTEAPTEAPTQAPSNDTPTQAPTQAPTKPSNSSSAPSTKAEILALYNKAANNVKTNAKKVTRNYEDLQHNEEYLQAPGPLQSIGASLISQFLKKDETPVVYGTKQEIIDNFPAKGETYSSKATEADLADAKCTDDGKYYNVTLKFKESVDPAAGTGAASAFSVIKSEEVYEATSVVKNFSAKYYDATIVAKIDKATGNLVSATFTLPIILQVQAQVITTIDAQVGMTFIDDYSVEY